MEVKMKKNWYASKTIWSAIALTGLSLVEIFGVSIPQELYVIVGSFGLYGFRDAMSK